MTARKPTSLKILEGTTRKDRRNPLEPRPDLMAGDERPPTWLKGKAARRGWREVLPIVVGLRVATAADRLAVGMLCAAFGRWLDARDALGGLGGPVYETVTPTGSVMRREHPEVGREERAWSHVMAALREFGMTPASRPRVSEAPGAERPADDDWMARAAKARSE